MFSRVPLRLTEAVTDSCVALSTTAAPVKLPTGMLESLKTACEPAAKENREEAASVPSELKKFTSTDALVVLMFAIASSMPGTSIRGKV